MSQKITSLHIDKLKGLENLDISFEDKNVTAIFGANGCGKSTILHTLACIYKGISQGAETNYFTRFFKRIGTAKWAGSHMTAHMLIDEHTKAIVYKKSADRWTPRIDKRVERDSYYIGIESCVPDIEKESASRTSYIMTPGAPVANREDIIRQASRIMGRTYDDYAKQSCAKRNYKKVGIQGGTQYSSLSMGAGEQRIFTILDRLYSVPEDSLILIDELDLTMHTVALNRLVDTMVNVANSRNLQIVFTSHRENLAKRTDINIRHIWKPANQNQSFCLDHTTPMCMYRLNGEIKKEFEVYVEDDMAEAIVRSVLRQEDINDYVSIIRYGDASNAFSVAAGLHIEGELSEKQLILIDGDVYKTDEDKLKMMKKRYAGNEAGKDQIRQEALQRIKDFKLPDGEQPEHFLWTMLKTKQGKLAELANGIDENQDDRHGYIYDVYLLQGECRAIFLKELIEILETDNQWENYVSEVKIWAQARKTELGLV